MSVFLPLNSLGTLIKDCVWHLPHSTLNYKYLYIESSALGDDTLPEDGKRSFFTYSMYPRFIFDTGLYITLGIKIVC